MLEDIGQLEKNLFKMFEGVDKLIIIYEDSSDSPAKEVSPPQKRSESGGGSVSDVMQLAMSTPR